MELFPEYIGREERRSDILAPRRVEELAALLDCDVQALAPDGRLPALAHWLYFTPWVPQSQLGPDGHPRRGDFIPPIPLPRRMFAGARLAFQGDLKLGDRAERVSRIESVKSKTGASGELVFVTISHEILGPEGPAIREEQDLVYRSAEIRGGSKPAQGEVFPGAAYLRVVQPDPVLLFRFSALTSNAHRIHYDRPYAVEEEGYPGLVVHGPLQAFLLMDLIRTHLPDKRVKSFRFQARRALFDVEAFKCVARPVASGVELATTTPDDVVCMSAHAEIA